MANDSRFVNGAAKLSRRIATIRTNLALPVLTEGIGQLLLKRTQDRFDREVDPDGLRWVDLKESTLRRKRQEGYGDKTKLKRTESMRKAITLIRGNVAGTIFTNTGAGVRIGIKDPKIAEYAAIQNRGGDGIPARRFLGIGALDIKAVDSYLRRQAKQAVESI